MRAIGQTKRRINQLDKALVLNERGAMTGLVMPTGFGFAFGSIANYYAMNSQSPTIVGIGILTGAIIGILRIQHRNMAVSRALMFIDHEYSGTTAKNDATITVADTLLTNIFRDHSSKNPPLHAPQAQPHQQRSDFVTDILLECRDVLAKITDATNQRSHATSDQRGELERHVFFLRRTISVLSRISNAQTGNSQTATLVDSVRNILDRANKILSQIQNEDNLPLRRIADAKTPPPVDIQTDADPSEAFVLFLIANSERAIEALKTG